MDTLRWYQVWRWRDVGFLGASAVSVYTPFDGKLAAWVYNRGDLGYRVVANPELADGAYLMADAGTLVEAVGFARYWAESA